MDTKSKDIKLITGLRAMDDFIIDQIYQKYYPMILKMVWQNNGSSDDARDVFQETMIIIFENAKKSSFELTSGLGTYLYAVSRNIWLKKRTRTYDRELNVSDNSYFDVNSETNETSNSESFTLLKKYYHQISEKCREVLRLSYYSELKDKEIAGHLNLSGADYVKTQRYRCIKKLRELFEKKHAYEK